MDRFTSVGAAPVEGNMMCSTPVGVMDRFTADELAAAVAMGQVLNACRRHGSVHNIPGIGPAGDVN